MNDRRSFMQQVVATLGLAATGTLTVATPVVAAPMVSYCPELWAKEALKIMQESSTHSGMMRDFHEPADLTDRVHI